MESTTRVWGHSRFQASHASPPYQCLAGRSILIRFRSTAAAVTPRALESVVNSPVTGTVQAFQWTNPHSYIQLVVKDAHGREQEWSCEMGAPMQFVIAPEETLIVNMYREVRHIYADGRCLVPDEDRWITTWGESIGHWKGDTLVIETAGVRHTPDFFLLAPPLSEHAHYPERIRPHRPRVDGSGVHHRGS